MGKEDARSVREFILRRDGISTIPSLLGKILLILRDENASPRDLYRTIAHDQAVAERVIRMANSAMFGRSGTVRDIGHAILFLGYDRIRSIALGLGVLDAFPAGDAEELRALWIHGYEVGFIAAAVSETVSIAAPAECFLSGLVHDIGRVILCEMDAERFRRIGTSDDMFDRERELFGCTHPEAGSWYALHAGIPEEIAACIRYHHSPSGAGGNRLTAAVVAAAELLARRFRPAPANDGVATPGHEDVLRELSIGPDRTCEIARRIGGLEYDIKSFFG